MNALRFFSFFLCFFCVAKISFADEPLRHVYTPTDNPINFSLSGRFMGNADLEGYGGGYSVGEYATSLEWKKLSFTYTGRKYNWDNAYSLPFGNGASDPWETLHKLTLGIKFDGSFENSPKWGWFGGVTGISAFEDEMAGSLSAFVQGGLTYDLDGDWNTSFGVLGIFSQDDPLVLPFVRLNYRSPRDLGWSAIIGFPATYASYRFNDVVAVRAGANLSGGNYKLADDSSVVKGGYLEEQELTTGLYADITPQFLGAGGGGSLRISIGAEYTTLRELKFYDSDYNKLMENDVDDSFGGLLRVQYTF